MPRDDEAGARSPEDPQALAPRRARTDARRNFDSLLRAAAVVFEESGVAVPAKEIAVHAGVGVGTLYRHFPRRSDLVVAVFRQELDDCAAAASALAQQHAGDSIEALTAWLHRYLDFIVTKRGLAAALHSGDAALADLHAYFDDRLDPALGTLLEAAAAAGEIRTGTRPHLILHAVRSLCLPDDDGSIDHARPVVDLLIDGLRFSAPRPPPARRETPDRLTHASEPT